jgi:hypothetical protein
MAEQEIAAGRSMATEARKRLVRSLLRIARGEWLDDSASTESRRFLSTLLFGVYAHEELGNSVSMRDACGLMGTDVTTTGPKYVKLAAEQGWVTLERRPAEDQRKVFVRSTAKLRRLLDAEVARLSEDLRVRVGKVVHGRARSFGTVLEGTNEIDVPVVRKGHPRYKRRTNA